MKHIIEFNPVDERLELMQATLANLAWFTLGELLTDIRKRLRYDEKISPEEIVFLEGLRTIISDKLSLLESSL
jgi:hypothetical protein